MQNLESIRPFAGVVLLFLLTVHGLPGTAQAFCPEDGAVTPLPIDLRFEGGGGGCAESGFTTVMPDAGSNTTANLVPSLVSLGSGLLRITTSAGDVYKSRNDQQNALAVRFNATGAFEVAVAMRVPFGATSNYDNAGIWFGYNEDNYLKLIAGRNGGDKLQLVVEENAAFGGTGRRIDKSAPLGAATSRIVLRMRVAPGEGTGSAGKVDAFYRIDDGPEQSVGTILTVPAAFFSPASYAGVIQTNYGNSNPWMVNYEFFTIVPTGVNLPPAQPTGLSATGWDSQVTLNWTPNSEADLAGYRVYRSTTQPVSTAGTPISGAGLLTTASFADTTVLNGTTYYYVVVAVDTAGQSSPPSDTASATPQAGGTPPPGTPTGFTATPGASTIGLTWNAVTGATGYNVYRDTTSGVSTNSPRLNHTPLSSTSFVDSVVVPDVTYYYIVTAVNAGGESAPTSPLAATILPPDTSGWETETSLPVPRYEMGVSVVDGKMYVAGGRITGSRLNDLSVYDPVTRTWSTLTPFPGSGRDHAGMVAIDGYLYFVGGLRTWPKPSFANVYRYHVSTDTWTEMAPLPAALGAMAIAMLDGRIYVAGGLRDGIVVNDFFRYDPATNTWERLPDLPTARDHVSAAVLGGKIYVIGGRPGPDFICYPFTIVEVFDPATNQWSTGAPLLTARGGHAVGTLNGRIQVFGGEGGGDKCQLISTSEEYDPETNSWSPIAPMPTLRHGLVGATLGNSVYIPGGSTAAKRFKPTPVHERYFQSGDGSPSPDPPPARPSGLTAAPGDSLVSLGWNPNSEPDLAGYHVYRSTSLPVSTGGIPLNGGTLVADPSYLDDTVVNGTQYHYVVIAVDNAGNRSAPSDPATATPTSPDGPPAAPTGLHASGENGQVILSWTPNSEPDLAGYNLYRHTSLPVPTTGTPVNGATLISTSAYVDMGVTNGTTYYYVVVAVDTGNHASPPSEPASATPGNLPPAKPTGLHASPGDSQVILSWTPNSESDLAGYDVFRSTALPVSINGQPLNGATPVTTSAYVDGTVQNDTLYYYVVVAVDLAGQRSAPSDPASATPKAVDDACPNDSLVSGLPVSLSFGGGAGGCAESGFTSAMPDAGSSTAPHLVPELLNVSGGLLRITTTAGDPLKSVNSQQNALAIRFGATAPFEISTVLRVPLGASANYDSAGIWFGYSEDNYLKLTAGKNGGDKLQLVVEENGKFGGTGRDIKKSAPLTSATSRIVLRMRVAPGEGSNGAGKVEAYYQLDNGPEENIGTILTVPAAFFSPASYAGVIQTNYGNTASWIAYYDAFTIVPLGVNLPPAQPAGLSAQGWDNQVSLSWTANSEPDLAGYRVYRDTTEPVSIVGPAVSGSALITTASFVDTTAVNGTTYYYVVVAVDTAGQSSPPSPTASATPQAGLAPPPATPTGLTATAGTTAIRLDWQAVSTVTGYNLYRDTTSSVDATGIPLNGGTPLTVTTYTDADVAPGVTYYYVVTAVNASGTSAPTNPVSARVSAGVVCGLSPNPTTLTFAGGIADTYAESGFNCFMPGTNPPDGTGLALNGFTGDLLVTSTAGDINGSNNTQHNALAVKFQNSGSYSVRVRIQGPFSASTQFQAAGVFLAVDADNYAKFVLGAKSSALRLQFAVESGGSFGNAAPDISFNPANLDGSDKALDLWLVRKNDGRIEALYRLISNYNDSPAFGAILSAGGTSSAPAWAVNGTELYGGLLTTNNGTTSAFTTTFDEFQLGSAVTAGSAPGPIGFSKKVILKKGETMGSALGIDDFAKPTSIALGPDDKLYVATQLGKIYVLTLDRLTLTQLDQLAVTHVQILDEIHNRPTRTCNIGGNPDNCAYLAGTPVGRQVTGIAIGPESTPTQIALYVSHSDPRIGKNNSSTAKAIDTWSGVVTRLTLQSSGGQSLVANSTDLLAGLPRSRENHSVNGMSFGPDGWLYISLPGHTNYGQPSTFFSYLPEYYLAAAIVRLNHTQLAGVSLPLDMEGVASAADLTPYAGLFEVYATGFRNAYDIVWHSNGKLYANDNAGNNGLGNTPDQTDGCPTPSINPGTLPDTLHMVLPGSFNGHPNPARSECVLNDGTHYDPDLFPEPNYIAPLLKYNKGTSTNGIVEYTSNAFGGQMRGNLVSATYAGNKNVRRVELTPDGTGVVKEVNLGAFTNPLDVTTDITGIIYVAEYGGDQVTLLIPNDLSGTCPDPNKADSDGDGYTDEDEIAHGTDPCNPASFPPDFDGDYVGDLTDPDIDGDGLLNEEDQLTYDPDNGANTPLPLAFEWNPGDDPLGKIADTGFTGAQIATNGPRLVTDAINVGAAGGFMALGTFSGTAEGSANSQVNALQVGFDSTAPFRIWSLIAEPFNSVSAQTGHVAGIFFGPDQDNFVRLALIGAENGEQRLQLGFELQGAFAPLSGVSLGSGAIGTIDFYLVGDPAARSITASYRIDGGVRMVLGEVASVPAGWFSDNTGEARNTSLAGVMVSHGGATPMSFVYDFFRIDRNVTFALPAPTNLTATAQDGRVELRWNGVTGATGYHVYRSTQSPVDVTPMNLLNPHEPIEDNAFNDEAVVNGITYYYVVVAVDSISASPPSNEASATP